MTESPRRNILLMKRSLLTGRPFFPWAFIGASVHISLTFSSTMLQWRSKAFTRASNFLLFRQEIKTWVWLRTAVCRMERGPAVNSCSSSRAISYSLNRHRHQHEELAGWQAGRLGSRRGKDGTYVRSARGLFCNSLVI